MKTRLWIAATLLTVGWFLFLGVLALKGVLATPSANAPHKRGRICDARGNVLAEDSIRYDLLVYPHKLNVSPELVVKHLGSLVDLDNGRVVERLNKCVSGKCQKGLRIKRYLAKSRADTVQALIGRQRLKGVRLRPVAVRTYPQDTKAAALIGHLVDRKGAVGVEKACEETLRPTPSSDGAAVRLTIDLDTQRIVEEEISLMVNEQQPANAYAILVNPSTGGILSLVQYPSASLSNRKDWNPTLARLRVAEDVWEFGGPIKPLCVAGAIENGAIHPDTKVNCENGNWTEVRLRDTQSCGTLTSREVLTRSSNIGAAKIGAMLGDDKLFGTLTQFGFGRKTRFGLEPESPGILHPKKRWDRLSNSRISIGYSMAATPLQLVQAYCAFANRGLMPQLHVIAGRPPSGRRVISQSTARTMAAMLADCTQKGGVGHSAAVPGSRVAGIPGTAQKLLRRGRVIGYSNKDFVASFIGFAPVEQPRFMLLILVDCPKNGRHGNTVAAPVFRRVMARLLATGG